MKIKSRWLQALLCRCAVWGFELLFRTTRKRVIIADPDYRPYAPTADKQSIYTVWHDVLLFPTFMGYSPAMVGLVGPHRDGEYVSQVLEARGMGTVRGSSTRGGAKAVVAALRELTDKSLVMTPDGPRGPRRELKLGCVFLAAQAGIPVTPTAYAGSNCWKIKGSWTDLVIPKPFSKTYAITGRPIFIPENPTKDQLRESIRIIQAEMDRLHSVIDAIAAGEELSEEEMFGPLPERTTLSKAA